MTTKNWALVSGAVYVLSLAFYGLAAQGYNSYGFEGYRGVQCLLMGWMTVFGGKQFFLPWTANLFYSAGFLMLLLPTRPPRWGALIPLAGLLIALMVFRIDTVMVNEAGHRAPVQPGPGAWLWLSSFALLIVGFFFPARPSQTPLPE